MIAEICQHTMFYKVFDSISNKEKIVIYVVLHIHIVILFCLQGILESKIIFHLLYWNTFELSLTYENKTK